MTTTTLAKLKKSELIDQLTAVAADREQHQTHLIAVGVICFVLGAISF